MTRTLRYQMNLDTGSTGCLLRTDKLCITTFHENVRLPQEDGRGTQRPHPTQCYHWRPAAERVEQTTVPIQMKGVLRKTLDTVIEQAHADHRLPSEAARLTNGRNRVYTGAQTELWRTVYRRDPCTVDSLIIRPLSLSRLSLANPWGSTVLQRQQDMMALLRARIAGGTTECHVIEVGSPPIGSLDFCRLGKPAAQPIDDEKPRCADAR